MLSKGEVMNMWDNFCEGPYKVCEFKLCGDDTI
jgi:hypothetical protein